jgi:hypothetical protein
MKISSKKMLGIDKFQECEFEILKGHTLKNHILYDTNEDGFILTIKSKNGYIFRFSHEKDCCEDVYLEDGFEDLLDIVKSREEIQFAEKIIHKVEFNEDVDEERIQYTFYKLRTRSYSCTLRFYGASTGYYSEDVDFEVCKTED